ncbi:MAG TPA: SAM-dependent chlorinase/fluorinase, partial [Candidatus Sabulitectum sp.]|nr:SAM-dependent chlorinase/fluorinase [Candidatus Sabulitectum sp.]
VTSGAFHLRACLPFLLPGSVTLAVVDPGVGTGRRGLAALWRERLVVCPDNGLISFLTPPLALFQLPPPDPAASSTFHGRDWLLHAPPGFQWTRAGQIPCSPWRTRSFSAFPEASPGMVPFPPL